MQGAASGRGAPGSVVREMQVSGALEGLHVAPDQRERRRRPVEPTGRGHAYNERMSFVVK